MFTLSFGRLRQRIVIKCVPHDYFSSLNQSDHCFLVSSLPLPSSLRKLPIRSCSDTLFKTESDEIDTPFKTKHPNNHTLSGRTSPLRSHKRAPSPGPMASRYISGNNCLIKLASTTIYKGNWLPHSPLPSHHRKSR